MKSNNPTDQIFRKSLGDYASEPPMHIWERIDQKRSPRHRAWMLFRRNWGVAMLALLLVGTVSFWMLDEGHEDLQLVQNEIITQENINNQNKAIYQNLNKKESAKKSESVLLLNSENPNSNNSNQEITNSDLTTSKVTQSKNNALSGVMKSTVVFSPEKTNIEVLNEFKDVPQESDSDSSAKVSDTFKVADTSPESVDLQEVEGENTQFDFSKIQAPSLVELKYELIDFDSKIPTLKRKPKGKRKGDPGKGCPEIDKGKKFNLYVDIIGGPQVAVRSLRAKSDDNVPYLNRREEKF